MQRSATKWVLAGLVLSGAVATLQGQMFANFAGNLATSRQLMQPVDSLRVHNLSSRMGTVGARASHPGAVGTKQPSRQNGVVLTGYRRDPRVSAQARAQFIATARGVYGDSTADSFQRDFAGKDVATLWGNVVRNEGYKPGDLADSLSAYIELNWLVANHQVELAPAGIRALLADVHQSLSAEAAVAQMSEGERQNLSETLMYNFILLAAVWKQALKNKEDVVLAKLSDSVESRSRTELGMDLRATRITPSGVVRTAVQ